MSEVAVIPGAGAGAGAAADVYLALLLAAAVRLGVPILLAALGEILLERSGIVNVGIEGMMLAGTLASVLASIATGSPWAGLGAGVLAGALFALPFALIVVRLGGDPVVTGTGINLLALGLTGFVYEAAFGRTGSALQVARFEPVAVPLLARIPVVGPALFVEPATAYLAYALAFATAWMLARTGMGLRLRAAGEEPRAVAAAGFSVARLQAGAALVAGAFAGAGGAALAIGHAGTFAEGMTAGRGFIALAIVLCARKSALGALAVSLVFGLLLSLQFEVQAIGTAVPYQVVRMAPYVGTIVLLAIAPRARR